MKMMMKTVRMTKMTMKKSKYVHELPNVLTVGRNHSELTKIALFSYN